MADHDHDLHVELSGEPFGAEQGDGVFEQGPFPGETGVMAEEPVLAESAAVARGADAREVGQERIAQLDGAAQGGLVFRGAVFGDVIEHVWEIAGHPAGPFEAGVFRHVERLKHIEGLVARAEHFPGPGCS